MKRITLAAGPSAPRPDYRVAGDLFRYIGYSLVVTKRIQIVLEKAGFPRSILSGQWRPFAKINLDRTYTQFKHAGEFVLIPFDCCRIAEIQNCILERETAALVFHRISILNDLIEELVF